MFLFALLLGLLVVNWWVMCHLTRRVLRTEFKVIRALERLRDIRNTLDEIKRFLGPREASQIEFKFAINNGPLREVVGMEQMKVSDKAILELDIKDVGGNPAKVDGAPVWSVDKPELAILAVAEDGLAAVLSPVGPVGLVKVTVIGDANLGAGVKPVQGELEIDLQAGEAASLAIKFALQPVQA